MNGRCKMPLRSKGNSSGRNVGNGLRISREGLDMRKWCLVAMAAASVASGCGSAAEEPSESIAASPELAYNANTISGNGSTAETVNQEAEGDSLTGPQRNALRSAKQYLSMSGFSRDGLIGQLSSDAGDGYSVADATAAVDSLDVDWNENAAKSAAQYLNMSGFSCQGLIEQLSSDAGDKYTVEQATFGARQAGAC